MRDQKVFLNRSISLLLFGLATITQMPVLLAQVQSDSLAREAKAKIGRFEIDFKGLYGEHGVKDVILAPKEAPYLDTSKPNDSPAASILSVEEIEPNNHPENAQALRGPTPIILNGNISTADEGLSFRDPQNRYQDDLEDLFSVTLLSPGLSVKLSGHSSDCDLYLIWGFQQFGIYNFERSINPGKSEEQLVLPNLSAGNYIIGVSIYDANPQGEPSSPYVLTVTGDIANANTSSLITIDTDPGRLAFEVDGVSYLIYGQKFNWPIGSMHLLTVPSPQTNDIGIQLYFSRWSDGGAQTHTIITPNTDQTFTAFFDTQPRVNISGRVRDSQKIGLAGVQINFSNQGGTATTDNSGFYGIAVPSGWSGIAKPSKPNFDFVPSSRAYTSLAADTSNQDYVGYPIPGRPAPPTDLQVISVGTDSAHLKWTDNSSNEDGFVIRRGSQDTRPFLEVGRVPADSTQFVVYGLQPGMFYIFHVRAFNAFGESDSARKTTTTPASGPPVRPTNLTASPRSESSILLTWKDNSQKESGFLIQRKQPGDISWTNVEDGLPQNSRFYLDKGLAPNTQYEYRVLSTDGSAPSNVATARTEAITSMAQHTKGLEVDNQGGGAGGWSHFKILEFDQLYDGHLQIWNGGEVVHDGDDGDFTSPTAIVLHDPSSGIADEHTSAASGPRDPVIIRSKGEAIEIHQYTYQQDDKNWILIEWIVINNGSGPQNVKLAFFLDADAGGELSVLDRGDFDETRKMVYLKNEGSGIHFGMALISEASFFENYQISPFADARTPDNSPAGPAFGERARRELLKESKNTGTLFQDAADLTMTLVSNLGILGHGDRVKVMYALAAGANLGELQNWMDDAAQFAPCAFPCFWADVDCDRDMDILDVQKVAAHWNTRIGNANYDPNFDVDHEGKGDGDIDIVDIQLVAAWWNKALPSCEAAQKSQATQVSDKKLSKWSND
ncbi:fibronectin type III domain-containing protein [candidate division KSB1 bacterium]|nr:fibronectin type III domain-containing protein [candidate division KSB1 bacterium]